ncbi:Uncharacterised protein [Halioglobus japonicus]|nr:Uncharacterised protein [Halioglobus japonicus]
MTEQRPEPLPNEVHSQADGRALIIAIARHRLAALGVYTRSGLAWIANSLGIAFVVAIDVTVSGQIGRFFFEPIPGATQIGLFGWKTVLAATLLSALVQHLASQRKQTSAVLRLIDEWAPRFALIYIAGASLLLMATMSGAIYPEGASEFSDADVPVLSQLINDFSAGLLNPVAKLAFALGFGTVLVGTIFALSKLLDGWFTALRQIVDKATHARALAQAAQVVTTTRVDYRHKAARYNAAIAHPVSDEQLAFALMVYQTAAAVIADLRSHANKRPQAQFPSYRSPASEVTGEAIDTLAASCTLNAILAAIRTQDTQDSRKGSDTTGKTDKTDTPNTEDSP